MDTKPRWKLILAPLLIALFSLGLAGCPKDGPAEEAGEKVDEAIEDVQDGAEDVGDDISDGLEDAGDEIEDATD